MMWLKANMCVKKMDLKSKDDTTYDNFSSQMMWMVMDGRDRWKW